MITLQKIVWDIRRVLRSISDDSTIKDLHLIEKINHYRAQLIEKQYNLTMMYNPEWIQSLIDEPITQVNSGDIPGFVGRSDLKFGKLVIPSVLFNERGRFGIMRINAPGGWNSIHLVDQPILQLMIEIGDWRLDTYLYYMEIGNALYFYNYFGSISARLILADPREGYVYNTTKVMSGDVLPDVTYVVKGGIVNYSGIFYDPDDTLVGVALHPSYTGQGKLYKYPQKWHVGYTDLYPIDEAMAQEIIWTILNKDYQIERSIAPDDLNDATDEVKTAKS